MDKLIAFLFLTTPLPNVILNILATIGLFGILVAVFKIAFA